MMEWTIQLPFSFLAPYSFPCDDVFMLLLPSSNLKYSENFRV